MPLPTTAAELLARYAKGERDFRARRSDGRVLDFMGLGSAELRGVCLADAILDGNGFRHVDFRGADLVGVRFRAALLSLAKMQGAQLIRADLTSAIAVEVQLESADLSHACLRGARLRGSDVGGAKFEGVDLSGADLTDVTRLTVRQLRFAVVSNTRLPDGTNSDVVKPEDWGQHLTATHHRAGD